MKKKRLIELRSLKKKKRFQALQSQKRSKPMARCSAVINSSSGFSHVLIIGSGQSVNDKAILESDKQCLPSLSLFKYQL